jgi:hypothetical protein
MEHSRETPTAYPLSWPFGWKRTPAVSRGPSNFRVGQRGLVDLATAIRRLEHELQLLGAADYVLSSNVRPRLGGSMGANIAVEDPGVAVYFQLRKQQVVLACDRWARVPDNIAAIAAHIGALRGQERWGVGTLEQAFTGYQALPPPGPPTKRHWQQVLLPGLGAGPNTHPSSIVWTIGHADLAYRNLAKERQGNHEQMVELNQAIAEARRELQKEVSHAG